MAPARTVQSAIVEWLAGPGADYSERGREKKQFTATFKPLLRLFGPTPAAEFGCDQLEELQRAMASGSWMTEPEKEKARKRKVAIGWCRTVVNRRVVRVRTVWRWLERKKIVPAGAWASLRAVPGLTAQNPRVRHKKKEKPPTRGDFLRVARKATRLVRIMLLLQWYSGMRPGEIRILRRCDLDTSDPLCWVYRPAEHKQDWRGQERAVPLGKRCIRWLSRQLARVGSEPEAAVFAHRRRAPYKDTSYAQAVRRAAERAGLKGFHSYLCRHSMKQRITSEQGLDIARAVLGQKSIESTNGYGDATDLDLAKRGAR
jgi:integrase